MRLIHLLVLVNCGYWFKKTKLPTPPLLGKGGNQRLDTFDTDKLLEKKIVTYPQLRTVFCEHVLRNIFSLFITMDAVYVYNGYYSAIFVNSSEICKTLEARETHK